MEGFQGLHQPWSMSYVVETSLVHLSCILLLAKMCLLRTQVVYDQSPKFIHTLHSTVHHSTLLILLTSCL